MKHHGRTAVILSVILVSLLAGCSSKQERENRAALAAGEQVLEDAGYAPLARIEGEDRDAALEPQHEEFVQVIDLPALPAAQAPMDPAVAGQDIVAVAEAPTPAPPPAPASYTTECGPLMSNDPTQYQARCSGRRVTGVGRVLFSYPSVGTVITVGSNRYTLALKRPADVAKVVFNDTVKFEGIVASKLQRGISADFEDVAVTVVTPGGNAKQLAARRALRLGALCLDLETQSKASMAENIFSHGYYVQQASLDPKQAGSGIVEVKHLNDAPQRCLIENNQIKFAQVGRLAIIDKKDVTIWEDRTRLAEEAELRHRQSAAEEEDKHKKAVKDYQDLSPREKAALMVAVVEKSAEAIADAIPRDISAEGYLESCNIAVERGLTSFKEQGLVGAWQDAARTCSNHAASLCTPEHRTAACKAYWNDARPIVSTMIDAL